MIGIIRNMLRRKVRTSLTVFGIAVGVFALTVMGAMSEGFATTVDGAVLLFSHAIQLSPARQGPGLKTPITMTTVAHVRQVGGVRYVANIIGGSLAEDDSGASFGPDESVYGVDPAYIRDFFGSVPLQTGRWLDPGDFRATVVGSNVAAKHHLGIGSVLTWHKNDYTVVGIMAPTNTFPDGYALMPFEAVRYDQKLPQSAVGELQAVAEPDADPEVVTKAINEEVPEVHAKSPGQSAAEIRQSLAIFSVLILGGAALAAIIGGLAVVNTMIMSVSERTREIGIKKALGADDRTIVGEFLAEAGLIGLLGGASGVWAGWIVATILNAVLAQALGGSDLWHVTPRLVAIVMTFALGLGLVAGVYPALSAARLDPVVALRAE
jgi:putative ABC transport system permease protein